MPSAPTQSHTLQRCTERGTSNELIRIQIARIPSTAGVPRDSWRSNNQKDNVLGRHPLREEFEEDVLGLQIANLQQTTEVLDGHLAFLGPGHVHRHSSPTHYIKNFEGFGCITPTTWPSLRPPD
jgi:hypothetical protein